MDKKKVLYLSQEITPYLSASPMATLGQMLPQNIQSKGFEVRTFMPKYGCINERRNQLHEVIRLSVMNIVIDDADHQLIIKVATLQPARMQVYFIDNDDYFQRHSTDGLEIHTSTEDNDERSMFFVRGVVETVKKLRWDPAVVHCSGWVTALAPMYLKRMYQDDPSFHSTKIVYALHEDNFEGTFDPRFAQKLLMDQFTAEDIKLLGASPVDYNTLNKLAMQYADGIVQASANVAPELREFALASGKPFLDFPGEEDYAQAYGDFYNSL